MAHDKRRQRGFTLGEMLTALAVVGIGLAVAVPSFQTITRNNRRATAVNQLVAAMHMARSEAVTRNQRVVICPSADGEACGGDWQDGWVYFPDPNDNQVRDEGEDVLGAGTELGALTVTSPEFGDYIVYRPNGRPVASDGASDSGQFTFCDVRGPAHAGVVLVSPIGQPVVPQDLSDLEIACPPAVEAEAI